MRAEHQLIGELEGILSDQIDNECPACGAKVERPVFCPPRLVPHRKECAITRAQTLIGRDHMEGCRCPECDPDYNDPRNLNEDDFGED